MSGSLSIRSSISLAVVDSGKLNFAATILTAIPARGPPAAEAMGSPDGHLLLVGGAAASIRADGASSEWTRGGAGLAALHLP